jgi:NAD+ kinase
MKKALLCPNPYRDRDFEATLRAVDILKDVGIESAVVAMFRVNITSIPERLKIVPLPEAIEGADIAITFGGDGSFLNLAKTAAPRRIPVLGVNMGSLGYMADLEYKDIGRLAELATKPLILEKRMMLDVKVFRDDRQIFSSLALNDAVVTKGTVSHIVRLEVILGNMSLNQVQGDGVIVSTPTGSTAYSLAAGGPVVEPTASNIIISPICAHALISNSYVLAPEHIVTIRPNGNGAKQICLSVDGGKAFQLRNDDRIQIKKSEHCTRVVRMTNYNFYELLVRKMSAERVGR